MAQYYPRSRNRSQQPPPFQPQIALSPHQPLDDSQLYIFPDPSSIPPSPSQSSDISAPTDFTFSGSSEPRSRESSVQRSWNGWVNSGTFPSPLDTYSPLTGETDGDPDGLWGWTNNVADESVRPPDDEFGRPDRWEILCRRRARSSPTQFDYQPDTSSHVLFKRCTHRHARSPSTNSTDNPHPRIYIPLLSFFISLLSIDDATLHLLSHSSSHSALFPVLLPESAPADEMNGQPHGVEKLFMPAGESRILKEGCAVACDPSFTPSNPFLGPGIRLFGLLGMVSDFVANGRKALHEVLHN